MNHIVDQIRGFAGNREGTSAVEFALILPLMVTLYLGCVEISDGVSVNRKVTAASSAIGDLVAQASVVDEDQLSDIFDAAEAVVAPYAAGPMTMVVSSIYVDDDSDAEVVWSESRNTGARAENSAITLPAGLEVPDTGVILAEVTYTYSSVVSNYFTGPIELSETFYFKPRKVRVVLCSDC